jgi:hypothetical protein
MGDNQITGSLPSQWSSWSNLQVLDLQYNEITETLPTEWSSMTSLEYLNLGSNQISGSLPSQWSKMPKLSSLDLSNNRIEGSLPSAWRLSWNFSREKLRLFHNFLMVTMYDTRAIPFSLDNLLTQQYAQAEYRTLTSLMQCLTALDHTSGSIKGIDGSLAIPGVVYETFETNGFLSLAAVKLKRKGSSAITSVDAACLTRNDIQSLVYLKEISLGGSKIEGSIEGLLLPRNLITLDLSSNILTGRLPRNLPRSLISLDLSRNQISDCLSECSTERCESISSRDGSCFNVRLFPPPLMSIDISDNKLFGTFTFDAESCLHYGLATANFSNNDFTSLDEKMFQHCMQNVRLGLKGHSTINCPLPSVPKNVMLRIDDCQTDLTGLYIVLGVIGAGALWFLTLWVTKAKSRYGIRDKIKVLLETLNAKFLKYILVSVCLNISDMILDVKTYSDMINEIGSRQETRGNGLKKSLQNNVVDMCHDWNANLDFSLEGLQREQPVNEAWKYIDTLAFFKDNDLLTAHKTTVNDQVVPSIKTPPYFFAMMKGLHVFERNEDGSTVVDTLIRKHNSTCHDNGVKSGYQFCYFNSTTYECRAKDHNLYDDFLLFVWASIAIVAIKELVKVAVIAYLVCCQRGGEGVPRGLRTLVLSSLFSPLLLLVISPAMFKDQLIMHKAVYQDEMRSLFYDVILENMNQLALGVVYITYITKQGIEWNQLALYPITAVKILYTCFNISKELCKKNKHVVSSSEGGGGVEMEMTKVKVNPLLDAMAAVKADIEEGKEGSSVVSVDYGKEQNQVSAIKADGVKESVREDISEGPKGGDGKKGDTVDGRAVVASKDPHDGDDDRNDTISKEGACTVVPIDQEAFSDIHLETNEATGQG